MTGIEYAYRRFATERFPLPAAGQVASLEKRLGVELPMDYRQFLLIFNGGYFSEPIVLPDEEFGCPSTHLTKMYGIGAPHPTAELASKRHLALFDDNDPPEILPIGSTPTGDLIVLVTRMDKDRGVILFKQAFGDFYFLADGIEEFFALLRERPQE